MNTNPVDEPGGDGAYADVAARLHAALAAPVMDAGVRQRHVQAIRDRAATLPTPAPAYAPTPGPAWAPAPASAPAPAPAPARAPVGAGWARRLASSVTAAGLVVVMGASGAVAASHGTLPGHALYPVKEVSERLVLAAALPAGLAVDRHLTFADRRLDEAATLVDRDGDPTLVAEAIAAHTLLLERAGTLADDDPELAGRVDAATLVARGRIAHLLDEGLPEVAADQARAALTAVQERLDGRPAVPPATPQAPPDAGAPEPRPDLPSPATPPDRTPAPRTPAAPGSAGEPGSPDEPGRPGGSGSPGEPATPPGDPGPPAQPRERQPSPQPDQASQSEPTAPRQQQVPGPGVTPSGPADDPGETGDRQRLPFGQG